MTKRFGFIKWSSHLLVLACVACVAVLSSSCKPADRPTVTGLYVSGSDYYVSGYYGEDTDRAALYWKNGSVVTLSKGAATAAAEARAICISGGSVYVSGCIGNNAVVWQDGNDPVFLSDGINKANGLSVFVDGDDVYVAGYDGANHTAVYWKNGDKVALLDNATAESIAVSGTDVHVAGQTVPGLPVYWKNGKISFLHYTGDVIKDGGTAESLFLSGSDVYIAGSISAVIGHRAQYWMNGIPTQLRGKGLAKSIFVTTSEDTTDVYVAGKKGSSAVYWKNNRSHMLALFGSAEAIFVSGLDVYAAGYKGRNAVCWKNSEAVVLTATP